MALFNSGLTLVINYPVSTGKKSKEIKGITDFNSVFGILRMSGDYSSFMIVGTRYPEPVPSKPV